jgi:hypothetical protein
MMGLVLVVGAVLTGCAWRDPAVEDDPRPEPVERNWVYPDYVWTNGSAEPHVTVVVFADTAAEGAGGGHVIEVVVDNRRGHTPVRPVEVSVGGPWRNEGDIEYFPVVSDFAPDCDAPAPDQECDAVATVAPGRVERLRFRGSWPTCEPVTSVGIDFSTDSSLPERGNRIDPGFELTPDPTATADGSDDGSSPLTDLEPCP